MGSRIEQKRQTDMSARVHHLKSRRALLGAVAASAVLAVAGFATSQAWGQSTGTAAATTGPTTTVGPAPASGAPASGAPTTAAPSGDPLAVAKNRVDLRIDRQVALIDRVSARVPSNADLSPAERTAVTGDLATLKSGLVALKAKVNADTTVAAVKTDVKAARSATKDNTGIEAAALYVRADDATAYLDAVTGRIATIQSKRKASGADTTTLNNALSDIQAKVTDAHNHLAGFDAALLSPDPPSAAQLTTAATALKAVQADLTAIRTDVRGLRRSK
jgi:hypothetical protein